MLNLSPKQMHDADAYTISHEPISSADLMERASGAFVNIFQKHYPQKDLSIAVYCGTGNNGGDGLAIARLLSAEGYKNLNVKIARFSDKSTPDFETNFSRIKEASISYQELNGADFPSENADLIIDALLGSGLNKPLSGVYVNLVNHLNNSNKTVVAVDVPTGFFTEGKINEDAIVLKAQLVITFQRVKINFLLPEAGKFMDDFVVAEIGLDKDFIQSMQTDYQLVEESDIVGMLRPRKKFQHKGTFGHALLIAGQSKTMGAALLCSSASVYAGSGLTTACIPEAGLTAFNAYMPEIMALLREEKELPEIKWDEFAVIAAGPGLGQQAQKLLEALFTNYKRPMVLDADALNMLSKNSCWWPMIAEGTIITPHMKEFDRLFGNHDSWWDRIQTAKREAVARKIVIVLKNQYTVIASPEGKLFFNTTGNPAMATGGMGDVLTGIVTALLSQGYSSFQAAIIAVFIHGKSGDDLALNRLSVVLPTQVAGNIPVVLAGLTAKKQQ